jgi:C4-dicarboxylate transporter DctQ subunit
MRLLDRLEEWLIATLMGAATLLVFVSVMHRYLAGLAIPGVQDWLLRIHLSWAQELCIIMFVWMAKFGAAYGVRTGIHVGVDVLVNRLGESKRRKIILFGLFAGAFFTAIVGTLGASLVWRLSGSDQTTPDLEMPSWIEYLAVPLGSYLMCFRFMQVAVSFWKTGELPHHDHNHVDGIETEDLPPDLNWYQLDNDSHPRDLKHRAPGTDGNAGDRR